MVSYMTPQRTPPMYIGAVIVQSTAPTTADQPRNVPQLNVRPGFSVVEALRTKYDLRIVCDPLH